MLQHQILDDEEALLKADIEHNQRELDEMDTDKQ